MTAIRRPWRGTTAQLEIYSDPEALARAAARRFVALAERAVAQRGRFLVALAGGTTPRPTYRLLTGEIGRAVAWDRVQILWGDERCVPPNHRESNYRMAREALLDQVSIPPAQIHRIQGELEPHQAAAAYEAQMAAVLGSEGRFDLVLLGLGADGHTASLFPGTPALAERKRRVVAVYVKKLQAWRITLTLPAINAARQVVFLVSGADKAAALARAGDGKAVPAGRVDPAPGTLAWMVDRAAATEIT